MAYLTNWILLFVIATCVQIAVTASLETESSIASRHSDIGIDEQRPRKFTNVEELRSYLDNLRKAYANAARNRYGKRGCSNTDNEYSKSFPLFRNGFMDRDRHAEIAD